MKDASRPHFVLWRVFCDVDGWRLHCGVLFLLVALVLGACGGGSGDNKAAVKSFCDVLDRTEGQFQANDNASLSEINGYIQQRVDAAPPSLKATYVDYQRILNLPVDEEQRPSNQAQLAKDEAKIHVYAKAKCNITLKG